MSTKATRKNELARKTNNNNRKAADKDSNNNEVDEPPRTKKELKKYRLKIETDLIAQVKCAMDQIQDISNYKPGQFKNVNGNQYDRKKIPEIKQAVTLLISEACDKLTAPRKRKTDPNNKGKNGLYNAKFVTDNLRKFVAECDFGDAYDEEGNNLGPLQDHIPLLAKEGITCNATLTPVFCTYVAKHGIQNPKKKQQIIPTEEFKEYFGEELEQMKEEDKIRLAKAKAALKAANPNNKREYAALELKLEKEKDRLINIDSFKYARFPGISSKCTIKAEDMTEEQKKRLEEDKDLEEQLKQERAVVSITLKHHGKNKKVDIEEVEESQDEENEDDEASGEDEEEETGEDEDE